MDKNELLFDYEILNRFQGKHNGYTELEEPHLFVKQYKQQMCKLADKYEISEEVSRNVEDYIDIPKNREIDIVEALDKCGFALYNEVRIKISKLLED